MSFEPLFADGGARLQRRILALFGQLAPNEGYTHAAIDGVRFIRSNRPVPRMPVLYDPSIVVVCQGRKRGYVGEQSFVYDAQQYLVLSVPLPFECETFATPDEPFLAISIRIDLAVIAELAILLDETHGASVSEPAASIRRRSTRRSRTRCCACSRRLRRPPIRACSARRSCARSAIAC